MKIKVGIRGYCGLLGSRLALAIKRQRDMKVTTGIVKNDKTLRRLTSGLLYKPDHLYMDEKKSICDAAGWTPADQAKLSKNCDILIDAAAGDLEKRISKNSNFKGPVIYQSGDYPHGHLISPPYVQKNKKTYRQGDCILSALSPVIKALEGITNSIRIQVSMQLNSKLNDYPTRQRIASTYLGDELEEQINTEFKKLVPDNNVKIDCLYQRPGFDYYDITLMLKTKNVQSHELEQAFDSPRIKIVDAESTYEIDQHYREDAVLMGRMIAPITIYRKDLQSTGTEHRIRMSVYSKLIAVLPNIDAIRIIIRKDYEPLQAMRFTDKRMKFI